MSGKKEYYISRQIAFDPENIDEIRFFEVLNPEDLEDLDYEEILRRIIDARKGRIIEIRGRIKDRKTFFSKIKKGRIETKIEEFENFSELSTQDIVLEEIVKNINLDKLETFIEKIDGMIRRFEDLDLRLEKKIFLEIEEKRDEEDRVRNKILEGDQEFSELTGSLKSKREELSNIEDEVSGLHSRNSFRRQFKLFKLRRLERKKDDMEFRILEQRRKRELAKVKLERLKHYLRSGYERKVSWVLILLTLGIAYWLPFANIRRQIFLCEEEINKRREREILIKHNSERVSTRIAKIRTELREDEKILEIEEGEIFERKMELEKIREECIEEIFNLEKELKDFDMESLKLTSLLGELGSERENLEKTLKEFEASKKGLRLKEALKEFEKAYRKEKEKADKILFDIREQRVDIEGDSVLIIEK